MKFLLLTNYSTKFNEFYFDGNHMNFDKFCFFGTERWSAPVAQGRKSLAAAHLACVASRLATGGQVTEVWVQLQAPAACPYMQVN